jgi:16S rRNA (cytosine967-C5)-methyltransferase
MKQAARIQAVIEILEKMATRQSPMDNTVRDYLHPRRYVGAKDRADIVERVYRIVRQHARHGWHIARAGAMDTPRTRVIADMASRQEYPKDFFIGGTHVPDPLTDDETALMEKLLATDMASYVDMPLAVRAECPEGAFDKLHALFGDGFEKQMAAMMNPAPLDLRVNTVLATREQAIESLTKDGVEVTPSAYSPVGLRAKGKPFMHETKAFRKGLVEIQDEGSQLIAVLTGAKPGMRILDFCAGGGGKTLALAAMMNNKGNVVAMDNDSRRLEKGNPRYRKAGVHNVELRSLEDEQNRKWLRRQKGMMDIVLVDAPCSSSGTWRRNPDLRWNQYGPSLEEIKILQADILSRVADKVKPGGRLVYATCSLFAEENEQQVEKFLAANPEYSVMPLSDIWPADAGPIPCKGPYLRLFPADHNTDGFFTAVMIRK